MKINIQQNNIPENLKTLSDGGIGVVTKLYEIALDCTLDSDVRGNILVLGAFDNHILLLNTRFPELNITPDKIYIGFTDPEVGRVLISKGASSDGVGITEADAANVNISENYFKDNTTITSFPEYGKFTLANGYGTGNVSRKFQNCRNLTEIDMSEITVIHGQDFLGTGITTINAPKLRYTNGSYSGYGWAYSCEDLTTVTSLGSIENIPSNCFYGCSKLTTVNLPNTCTKIDDKAFLNCSSLTDINISNIDKIYGNAFNGCTSLEINNPTLNATVIEQNAFLNTKLKGILNCPNLTGNYTNGGLFLNTKITLVQCLGNVSGLNGEFYQCGELTTVYLPYECTKLNHTFYECRKLTTVKKYNKPLSQYLEGETPIFNNLSGITEFNEDTFRNCVLLDPNIDFTDTTYIGKNAFANTLTSGTLSLPSLTYIGQSAFGGTKITKVTNLGSIDTLPSGVFAQCYDLTEITYPSTLRTVDAQFCGNSGIKRIKLPEGVTTIAGGLPVATLQYPFEYIEIPSTVTNMGFYFHRAFQNLANNTVVMVIKATTPPTLSYYSASEANSSTADRFSGIYVPDSSLSAYQSAGGAWLSSDILNKLKPISQLQTDNPTMWTEYLSGITQ